MNGEVDGETAVADGTVLVLMADQHPFPSGENRFCILQPLMTIDGRDLHTSHADFPNRGRIWWMLRDAIADQDVVPGSIWTSKLEAATKFELTNPDADKYQVVRSAIQPDGGDLLEVIDVQHDHPEVSLVTRGGRIPYARKPVGKIALRGKQSCLVPLRVVWHASTNELELQPHDRGKPQIIRVAREIFDQTVRVCEFNDLKLGQYDPHGDEDRINVRLTRMPWLKMDKLREHGEVLDASPDSQIISWALRQSDVTRKQRQELTALFERITTLSISDEEAAQKLTRLQTLQVDANRAVELGESCAAVLASHDYFRPLVETHVDAVTAERVAEEIRRREAEIETATRQHREQLSALQAELARLEQDFEKRAKRQDEELERRYAARIDAMNQREQDIEARQGLLDQQESAMQSRLERLIARLGTESEKMVDDLLLQLPLLRKLIDDGSHSPVPNSSSITPHDDVSERDTSRPATLCMPTYLNEPVTDEAIRTEDEFLQQFIRVVSRRNFLFSDDDLKNFHTCMKIGGLTVLAGQSGTGKSSLPQLYAEAMGWSNRYLHVPVRPDWLDDRDFVGAYNPLARRFEPSNSGVVDQLIAASIDGERRLGGIFILALDEMNLARVEHYFAQFLSILERAPHDRRISLFAPGQTEANDPYSSFRELSIGDNVRFVGTVNVDETTHFFSPKVLDRAQIVVLPSPDPKLLTSVDFTKPIPDIRKIPCEAYQQWVNIEGPQGELRGFLLKVSSILEFSRLGIRPRQFHRVLKYVCSSKDYLPMDTALDYQLMQVVLPRLRRTAPQFERTTELLMKEVVPERFPRSAEKLRQIVEPGFGNDFFQLL